MSRRSQPWKGLGRIQSGDQLIPKLWSQPTWGTETRVSWISWWWQPGHCQFKQEQPQDFQKALWWAMLYQKIVSTSLCSVWEAQPHFISVFLVMLSVSFVGIVSFEGKPQRGSASGAPILILYVTDTWICSHSFSVPFLWQGLYESSVPTESYSAPPPWRFSPW